MKILIVEDDANQRELLKHALEARLQQDAKLREAGDLEMAFRYLNRGDVDCVVLNLQLPDADGRAVFSALHSRYPELPIVVMTNNLDRDLALEMVKRGASDYLIKNYTNEEEIFRRVVFAVERQRRGLQVPYDQLAEASLGMARRGNPTAVTKRPHGISTIHVPEVGPKPHPPSPSLSEAPREPFDPAAPVAVDVDPARHAMERRMEELSIRLNRLLLLAAVLVLGLLVAVAYFATGAP